MKKDSRIEIRISGLVRDEFYSLINRGLVSFFIEKQIKRYIMTQKKEFVVGMGFVVVDTGDVYKIGSIVNRDFDGDKRDVYYFDTYNGDVLEKKNLFGMTKDGIVDMLAGPWKEI
jgi:hypothetical protein